MPPGQIHDRAMEFQIFLELKEAFGSCMIDGKIFFFYHQSRYRQMPPGQIHDEAQESFGIDSS